MELGAYKLLRWSIIRWICVSCSSHNYDMDNNGYIYHHCSKKAVDVNGAKIYFRGFKILQAVMQSLMEKGMSKADEVLLSGCSGMTFKK